MNLKNRCHKYGWLIFLFSCIFLFAAATTVYARVELGGDSINNDTSTETGIPKVTGLKADTITADSITVAWTPNAENYAFQAAISDNENTMPAFPTEQEWFTCNDSENPHYKFENLTADTMYYIRIRYVKIESAYPRIGLDLFFGESSDILSVKTLSETSETETTNPSATDSEPSPEDSSDTVFTISSCKYTVSRNQATVIASKRKTLTKFTIPATVRIKGKSIPVTAVAPNAFKGMQKLKNVVIGKNISKIGKNAFRNCKKLKAIKIMTSKLTSGKVGANAFKGIYSIASIKVPKKKLSSYRAFLKKKGIGKKVLITKY